MIPNRQSKSQMCRPFAVLRDKQDQQTSLARDLRQQTVHPRLLESTLEKERLRPGVVYVLVVASMSASMSAQRRPRCRRPCSAEGLGRVHSSSTGGPHSLASIDGLTRADPIPSYQQVEIQRLSANPNSFRPREELRCPSASEKAEKGPIGGLQRAKR